MLDGNAGKRDRIIYSTFLPNLYYCLLFHAQSLLSVTRGDEPSSPGDELPDDDDKTTPSSSSSSTSPSPIAPTSHEDHHDAKETAVEDTSTVWQDRLCARWDVVVAMSWSIVH